MMNNEPVAWWTGEFNDEADDFMFDKTKQNHLNHINSRTHEFFPIPLYTHPVKEYKEPSVKEIEDLWLGVVNNIPANDHRPREWHFANAILTKASKNE